MIVYRYGYITECSGYARYHFLMFLNLVIHEFQIWDIDGDWMILIIFLVYDCVAEYHYMNQIFDRISFFP